MNCLEELHRLWELLLSKLAEKGMKLQQALVLVQFLRQCDEVMFWINDKVSDYLLTNSASNCKQVTAQQLFSTSRVIYIVLAV